jgi:hypothetical protein
MGCLHLVQAIIVLAASQTVGNLKKFQIQLITSIPSWSRGFPEAALQVRGNLPFVAVTSGFAFLSAAAHFAVLLGWKKYISDLRENINVFRWYEYALSSSLMIALIAMLFGMWDVISLVLLASVNACMCLFGMDHELLNGKRAAEHVDWRPFCELLALMRAAKSPTRAPEFVALRRRSPNARPLPALTPLDTFFLTQGSDVSRARSPGP